MELNQRLQLPDQLRIGTHLEPGRHRVLDQLLVNFDQVGRDADGATRLHRRQPAISPRNISSAAELARSASPLSPAASNVDASSASRHTSIASTADGSNASE